MSKIYKINIITKKLETKSIICGNAKVFIYFTNEIQEQLGEERVKTAKQAQDELNAHGISWEEFDSKNYDEEKFEVLEEISITAIDVSDKDVSIALDLIADTFATPEPDEEPEEEENLPEPEDIPKYAKCKHCGYEDFLRENEANCRDCGKSLGLLTLVTCQSAECMAQIYVTDNIKICPYCETDLYTIEERCENAGVIPCEDPVKAAKVAENKRQNLLESKIETERDIQDYQNIVNGFNEFAIHSAFEIIKARYNKAFDNRDSKESDKMHKYKKSLDNLQFFPVYMLL